MVQPAPGSRRRGRSRRRPDPGPPPSGDDLRTWIDHAEHVLAALEELPAIRPALDRIGAPAAILEQRLADLAAEARTLDARNGACGHRARGCEDEARSVAEATRAWEQRVRTRLHVVPRDADPAVRDAVREVRRLMRLRARRFQGALQDLRSLVPTLRGAAVLAPWFTDGLSREGEALLDAAERTSDALAQARAAFARSAAEVERVYRALRSEVPAARRAWRAAQQVADEPFPDLVLDPRDPADPAFLADHGSRED